MSVRKRIKESYEQAKEEVKSLFKAQGDTRPNIPSDAPSYTGSLRADAQNNSPGAPGFERTSPTQVSTSQLGTQPRNVAPNVGNLVEQLLEPNRLVEEAHSDAAGPKDANRQMSGGSVVVLTKNTLPRLQDLGLSDRGVAPAGSQFEGSVCHTIEDKKLIQVAQAVPDTSSIGWKALRRFAGVLEPATSIFGPIKDVVRLFLECVDKCEMAGEAQKEYEALRVRLDAFFEDLRYYFDQDHSLAMTSSMERLCKSIQVELSYIQKQQDKSLGQRYLSAPDETDKILASYRRIEGHMQRLSLNVNLSMWKVVQEQGADSRSDRISSRVDRLPSALPAWYDSAEGLQLKRRACTSGTRTDALANVLGWARSAAGGGVYWLNGMAGTGKTTIAYSVCVELAAGHQLAASFFCSRLREECRNVNFIIPSISYQLARFSRPFQSALSIMLEKDPDAHGKLPHMQFDTLIAKPILEVQGTLPDGLMVVIDALDECEHKESAAQILDVLLTRSTSLPIKFIVSSRPEPEIRDLMADDRLGSRLVLHDLDKSQVQADIETYLRAELTPMRPTQEQIAGLVEKAGILFIYAATAVRYISYSNFHRNPSARLRTILNGSQGQRTGETKEIDQLYTTILEAAFGDEGLEEADQLEMQQVLYTVICAREPLTTAGLTELLGIDCIERVREALRPLWSVVHVVEATELVTTLHASFPDFMLDSTRAKSYHCNLESHNRTLAEHCFNLIKRTQPQFNICGLESSYVPDDSVPNIEVRVSKAISSELLYACRYWAEHMKAGCRAPNVVELLREFLSTRLLLWMEVLNLKKKIKAGMECMKLMVEYNQYEGDQELVELTLDAQRFVDTFGSNPISRSTPHIYISMLPFWLGSRAVSSCFTRFLPGPVQAEGTALDRRQHAHLATWAFDGSIETTTVSPDGLWVALGTGNDVLVVDSSSGYTVLGPLHGHREWVRSISFTPDGSRIYAGSISNQSAIIVGWDTRTGDTILGPIQLHGHTDYISRLTFSPNCTLIATGSSDNTVRLWSAENGTALHCLETQSGVDTVAFSPDSAWVAATWGTTLQAWDSKTGSTTLGPIGSDGSIRRMAFSPDGSHLAHANRHVIYIRNIQNGDIVAQLTHEHTSYITCIGYSLDGRYIASGSNNRTLLVWDAQRCKLEFGPLAGHTGYITSVAFMPDNSRIISGDDGGLLFTWNVLQHNLSPNAANILPNRITSARFSFDGAHIVTGSADGTISIWDSRTGDVMVGPIQAHKGEIHAIDILNNCIISGSMDGVICVHNALSGEIVSGPIDVHPEEQIKAISYSPDGRFIAAAFGGGVGLWNAQDISKVFDIPNTDGYTSSIQFSPDSTRIVACSWAPPGSVMVWDISNEKRLLGDIGGHKDHVTSVAYSPNGALIASGCSDDNTITISDAYTGTKTLGPITGHSSMVTSVNFSPDSTRLVSGSFDGTILIWDVQTGETILSFQSGHDEGIRSVTYSPDGTCILSCSYDGCVRIRDTQSTNKKALTCPTPEYNDWTMNKDGWVVDDRSRLLVWVPADLERAIARPRTRLVIPCGEVFLKFDNDCMGESWAERYAS